MLKSYTFLLIIIFLTLPCHILFAADSNEDVKKKPAVEQICSSVEERRLLLSLEKERQKLEKETKRIDERKKELKSLASQVDKKLDELKKTREKIESLLAQKSDAEQQRINDLAKIYQKMSPDKAAQIFLNIDEKLAISILEKMKIKTAAQLLSSVGRDKAVKLTTSFSSLNN